jgi:beta-galactosidase
VYPLRKEIDQKDFVKINNTRMKYVLRRIMISVLLLLTSFLGIQAGERACFDEGWLFLLGNDTRMSLKNYADSLWRRLDLPHDWSIEGDFSDRNPSGSGGGALPGGIGWYRKHFSLSDLPNHGNSACYFIDFDGVYMNSTVYLNGHELGNRPYGFSSFRYELTPYLNRTGDNVLAVKVDNSDQPNCRWYSGCGIYRHVWIVGSAALHIAHWGLHVISDADGMMTIKVTLDGKVPDNKSLVIRYRVLDPSGHIVAESKSHRLSARLKVHSPLLWSIGHPYVYQICTQVLLHHQVVDTGRTTTGFRSYRFDSKTGFWLNGKNFKINGVCDHHDLGCLGAALNEDALHRQLVMLKNMGCNAIRCSHNPPAPELLNMCDTMGFIVMDEAFDMWREKKTKDDYARFFDKWHERDLSDMIRRDRNHPCILMWSIGNEVLEQWSSKGPDKLTLDQANLLLNAKHGASALSHSSHLSPNSLLTLHLINIVKRYDQTRPITAGCNEPDPNNNLFKSGALDIIGYNYHRKWIKDVPKNFPDKPFIMTESVSALMTRGYYKMPSDSIYVVPDQWDRPYTDPSMMCSAYDNMHAPWSSTHEETWDVVKHTPYCCGQFIWTGWDYIGEPTPYGFPARSSYFGIIDLAGFPKDIYYMYQSEWTDRDVLHLFPHWNWLPGQTIDMWCYYNHADEVELFINGKSQGVRRKVNDHQYHVMWRVKFEPGMVKVVARSKGKVVREESIHTAGPADHILLTADRTRLTANGKNLSFVTVEIVDKDGNLCPNADHEIFFDVDGPASIAGVDNGCEFSMERFKDNKRKAFFGKCLVVLQSAKVSGKVTLVARGIGLRPAVLSLQVR